ncbi:MAG: formyltransferase family protein [Patescibacteria group bacterium]|nr:formyltransferase family protein [Patescibacteria group bacterium]
MNSPITLAVAGTTAHTKKCAQALIKSKKFQLAWALTPQAKPSGKNQEKKINPFHEWTQEQTDGVILVKNTINSDTKKSIEALNNKNPAQLLLVVDFGYSIPNWLLQLPTIAPVNIHPSNLPRWRGSSPGQYLLLAGDKSSAVTVMKLNNQWDQGPIIKQIPFEIEEKWNYQNYYQHSFELVAKELVKIILDFVKNSSVAQPQAINSPTQLALKIKKSDAFLPWPIISQFMSQKQLGQKPQELDLEEALKLLSNKSLLKKHLKTTIVDEWPELIERASRAFSPWPKLWTKIPTKKGEKRMQLLSLAPVLSESKEGLLLEKVKIEGQDVALWNQVKNILS